MKSLQHLLSAQYNFRTEDTTRSAFIVEDFEKRTRMNKKRARRRIQKLTKMRKTVRKSISKINYAIYSNTRLASFNQPISYRFQTSEHMRFKRSEHRLVERPGDKKQRHSFVSYSNDFAHLQVLENGYFTPNV